MSPLLDAFWRAAAYCLHPRVIVLSLLPLVLMGLVAAGVGYWLWSPLVESVRSGLDSAAGVSTLLAWFEGLGLVGLKAVLAPLLVVLVVTPVAVVVSLLVVAALMTPAMTTLVAARRFPALERRHGGSAWAGALAALLATLVAVLALLLSIPLWFVPPLVLIVPPLIWGWLTCQVMTYDVLAEHASRDERLELARRHRGVFLIMGVLTGYLGAAPSVVWASGALFVAFAPVLLPLAIWIYTLVFAFSALWFSHFALNALAELRAERAVTVAAPPSPFNPTGSFGGLPLPPA
jgi:hypothetical protein